MKIKKGSPIKLSNEIHGISSDVIGKFHSYNKRSIGYIETGVFDSCYCRFETPIDIFFRDGTHRTITPSEANFVEVLCSIDDIEVLS